MSNHEEQVKALRHCVSDEKGVTKCAGCPYYPDMTGCMDRLHTDAAAAIEALIGTVGDLQAIRERLEEENDALRLEPKRGEIVRCMECKWYQPDLCANPWGVCFHEDWVENNIGHTVDEDGFCYRGEREVQE